MKTILTPDQIKELQREIEAAREVHRVKEATSKEWQKAHDEILSEYSGAWGRLADL